MSELIYKRVGVSRGRLSVHHEGRKKFELCDLSDKDAEFNSRLRDCWNACEGIEDPSTIPDLLLAAARSGCLLVTNTEAALAAVSSTTGAGEITHPSVGPFRKYSPRLGVENENEKTNAL
jgi:hypothetical protein